MKAPSLHQQKRKYLNLPDFRLNQAQLNVLGKNRDVNRHSLTDIFGTLTLGDPKGREKFH